MGRLALMWGLVTLVVAATVALGAGTDDTFDLVLYSLLTLVAAVAGPLILRRHPRHGTGLLFCGLAAWLAVTELADSYGSRPGRAGHEYGEWVISWSWIGDMTLWGLILLTFPGGRVLGPRWRWAPWTIVSGGVLASVGFGLGTDEVNDSFAAGVNPLAVTGLPTLELFDVGISLVLLGVVTGALSLILRLRRARGIERQQVKWFAAAALLVAVNVPLALVFWFDTVLVQVSLGVAFTSVPVAAAVAILRYRLYDIDLVIRRTIAYTVLTAGLVGTYLGCVLLAQLVLPDGSDLGVALSTLLVAAAFRPALSRIQSAVDRRFFRSGYDVERTLGEFGARLRDEVTLDAVATELRTATASTLQPAHVSLWLRGVSR